MKTAMTLGLGWMRFVVVVTLLGWSCVSPSSAVGQSQGQNDVYSSSSSNFSQAGSSAFIDASVFASGGLDFCGVLRTILNPQSGILPSTGAVIDARGFPGTTGTNMTCSSSPWAGISAYPSTILLPAQQIEISTPWILPYGTRIIGEGAGGFEGSTPTLVSTTTLQACNTSLNNNCQVNFSGGSMIQMGDSTHCGASGICHSVVIEDLSLDGQNIATTGITNSYSQELSYVNRVNLYRVGVGLNLFAASQTLSAQNSGPYSNIVYNTGGSTGTCAQIEGLTSTRGIHGLTCQGSSDSPIAILLASSNTTLEDVRIVGFFDGVLIGSPQYPMASGNVLRNVFGDTSKPIHVLTPVYVIHVTTNASDTAIMGVSNAGGSGTYTIQDDHLPTDKVRPLPDPYISLYAVGKTDANSGGYSRFTTSPNANTWAAGSGELASNTACVIPGTIYSDATATGSRQTALWLCAFTSNGNQQWQKVK